MKKLTAPAVTALLLISAVCLCAADFWTAKPFPEWSDKDVTKMLTSSPWAKMIAVSGAAGGGGGGRGKAGGGGKSSMGEVGSGSGPAGGNGSAGGMPGSAAAGSASRNEQMEQQAGVGGATQSIQLLVTWESATPVKQALVKKKYGSEAGTSEEGKKYLERAEENYLLSVTLPPMMARGGIGDPARMATMKDSLKESTTLSVKGKDPIKPSQIEMISGKIFFVFPRTTQFTLDDKEVELTTQIGRDQVKAKFELKHMLFKDKLDI